MKYIRQKRNGLYMLLLSVVMMVLAGGCGMKKTEKVTCADTAMGTIVQQTLYVQRENSEITLNEIMELLDSLEKDTLSWREETSEVYSINSSSEHTGYVLSEKMRQYLEIIRDVWMQSNGAFDVTVGEVTGLWGIDEWQQKEVCDYFQLPAVEELQAALKNSGFEKIKIEGKQIYMPAHIQLDLGAVGKGIACDEVRTLLSENESVTAAVISIGGSVLTYGEKPDGSSWKVAIQHPRIEGETIAVLQLKGDWSISTSGDYERYVEKDGKRYHHIIDPKTGYPADSGLISVTIVSESGILSDALSTACFVLGKDAGLELAEEYGVQVYMVDKDLNVYMTEGMDKLLVLR